MKVLLKKSFCIFLMFFGIQGFSELKLLSFYTVTRFKNEPKIDGKLKEIEWEKALSHKQYYQYGKLNPKDGQLRSEFKMGYTEKGIYLAIINYENNMAKLRATQTERDSGELWRDDCAEIYFDHAAAGIAYRKFIVNSLGTVADLKRIDQANTKREWNGLSWKTKINKQKDRWIIESFFSWDDLGSKAKKGALWMFCHIRYAYSSGKFIGVTSSAGGFYKQPQNFGYLYFEGFQKAPPSELANILKNKKSAPWSFPLGKNFFTYKESGKIEIVKISKKVKQSRENILQIMKKIDSLNWKNPKYKHSKKIFIQNKKGKNLESLKVFIQIEDALKKQLWQAKIAQIFKK